MIRNGFFVCIFLEFFSPAIAQTGGLAVQQQLQEKNRTSRGVIALMLNQPVYAPGDTAFFSVWFTDEQMRLKPGDAIVHLSVYDNQGVRHLHQRIKVRNGRAINQLPIHPQLPAGRYKLVAFTPSMLGEQPQQFFSFWLDIETTKSLRPRAWYADLPKRAFAECDLLIHSLSATVFATGEAGTSASLLRDGEKIEQVTFPVSGLASFSLVPERGRIYAVRLDNENKTIVLPEVQSDGLMVTADYENLTIVTPTSSQFHGQNLFLSIVNRATLIDARTIVLEAGQRSRQVPIKNNAFGFTEFYISNQQGKVIAHRKAFTGSDLRPKLDLPEYTQQRDSIRVRVAFESNMFVAQTGTFAVSVIQKKLFDQTPRFALPYTPFPVVNEFLAASADRVAANQLLSAFSPPYFLGSRGKGEQGARDDLSITGEVFSTITNSPISDSTLVLAFLQNNTMGYETFTRKGRFEIRSMLDFFNNESVFVTLRGRNQNLDATHRVRLVEDTLRFSDTWSFEFTQQQSTYAEFADFNRLVKSSYRFFARPDSKQLETNNPNKTLEEEFLEADLAVDVEKFVVFPTMEVLVKEAVPFVQIRRRKQEKIVRLAYRTNNTTRLFQGNPLLVIDGQLTFNVQTFLNLSPADISFIKILNNPNKLAQLGKLGEFGVLFIQTKAERSKTVSPNSHYLNVVGLTRSVEFQPGQHGNDPRRPDFAASLFWNGNLAITSKTPMPPLRFTATDDIGEMILVLTGLTDDGEWIQQTRYFDVSRKKN